MPYSSTSDLPAQAKNLSPKQKRAFMQAFNSAHRDGKSEKSAFRIAWAAAKKTGGDEETSKHFEGEHDQADHGNRIRRARGEVSARKRRQRMQEVQGENFEETSENIVSWLHGRSEDQIEHLFMVDKRSGKVTDYNIGKERSAHASGKWVRSVLGDSLKGELEGNHAVFHNHPTVKEGQASMGAAPSPGDVAFSLGNGIDMHVVDSDEHVTLRPGSKQTGAADFVRDQADRLANIPLLQGLMDSEISGEEATYVLARERGHELWQSLTDDLNVEYEVKSLKKEKASKHLVGEHDQASHGRDEHTGLIRQAENPAGFTDHPEEMASDVTLGVGIAALGAAPFFLPGSKLANAAIESADRISLALRRSKGGKDAIAEIGGKSNLWNPANIHDVSRRLNDGGKITGKSKTMLDDAVSSWSISSNMLKKHYTSKKEVHGSLGKSFDYFTDAIAYAPESSSSLWRGMSLGGDDLARFTTPGERIPMGPSSFSASDDVAREFALTMGGSGTPVLLKTIGSHRSLRIEQLSPLKREREWVSGGEFVVRRAEKMDLPLSAGGQALFPGWMVEVEQVGGLVSKKAAGVGKSLVFLDDMDKSVQTMYRLGNLPAYYAKKVKG